MTKRLSPERIAKYAALPEERWNQLADNTQATLAEARAECERLRRR
jgi:hypothetical protein